MFDEKFFDGTMFDELFFMLFIFLGLGSRHKMGMGLKRPTLLLQAASGGNL